MFPLPRAHQAQAQATTGNAVDLLGNSLLPNEILSAIFDYLSPDALTRVALVSRRWRANAERALYSTIILHEVLPRASLAQPSPAFVFAAPADDLKQQPEPKGFQMTTTAMMTPTVTILPAVPITTLRCCETLSAHPRLAEYVRRFHLRWDTDAVESPSFLIHIAHHIARALVPTLVHLDSLELSFDLAPHFLQSAPNNNDNDAPPHILPSLEQQQHPPPPPSPFPPPHNHNPKHHHHHHHHQQQPQQPQPHLLLLPAIRHPSSLRTLALRGIGTPPSPELERILHNHPTLHHLRLSDYPHALPHLPPTAIPHLRSFRGHPATAASVLPGRPVQALGLVGSCESESPTEEEALARIATGSIPVRTLDLSGMSVTPALLKSVSRHLAHVEWLKVRLALRHTLHYALSGITLLTALTTVLAAFYNLRGLDLSPTNAIIQPTASVAAAASDWRQQQQNAAEEQRLCIAWMGACPSLRRVVFPSQTEWLLSEAGTWISGSGSTASRSRSPGFNSLPLPRCYLDPSELTLPPATPTRPI